MGEAAARGGTDVTESRFPYFLRLASTQINKSRFNLSVWMHVLPYYLYYHRICHRTATSCCSACKKHKNRRNPPIFGFSSGPLQFVPPENLIKTDLKALHDREQMAAERRRMDLRKYYNGILHLECK